MNIKFLVKSNGNPESKLNDLLILSPFTKIRCYR